MADPNHTKSTEMPKVDLVRDKAFLSQSQLDYMRVAEVANTARVQRLLKVRRRNLITAGLLGVSVVSIFGYSMWAIGPEKFLDEEDE